MELRSAMVYASGLYQLAEELGLTKEFREEISEISEILKKEERFSGLLKNPAITRGTKKDMLKEVFGGQVREEILSFLCLLTDKHRLEELPRIVREYIRIDDEKTGVGEGTVYSAVPLTEEQIARLEKETGTLLRKKIELRNEVDRSLLGGVRILAEGKVIDASFRAQLEEITKKIKTV